MPMRWRVNKMSSADKVTVIGYNVTREEKERNRKELLDFWKRINNVKKKVVVRRKIRRKNNPKRK